MMNYRSMSFHQAHPNIELVKLGAKLGFNDICFQTEGGTLKPLKELRERANEKGYFKLAKELGMTISVWVHELEDYDKSWETVTLENKLVWDKLAERYNYILTSLLPEIDYLVLTAVETEIKLTDASMLEKLVATILKVCRKNNKKLILRSFVWHPSELSNFQKAIKNIPDDVIIMTKNVPQDWHLRSIDEPLIGKVGGKNQYVELDIAGEYFRMDHVANCFTDILYRQYNSWREKGCDGISVRVDRGWQPEVYQNVVLNEAQEVNLWFLGYISTDRDPDKAWWDYACNTFGKKCAAVMIEALKTTGEVIAEGLCVERETFGDTRDKVPAINVMQEYKGSDNPRYVFDVKEGGTARAYDDNEDKVWRNPFYYNWSLFRWDESFINVYRKLRRGEPEIIRRKEESYKEALLKANKSLELIASVKENLPQGAYEFFNFKLEENKYHLIVMCELELAWLKCERRLYTNSKEERQKLLPEIKIHIDNLKKLNDRKGERLHCCWRAKEYHLSRGEYIDISEFIKMFLNYWQL